MCAGLMLPLQSIPPGQGLKMSVSPAQVLWSGSAGLKAGGAEEGSWQTSTGGQGHSAPPDHPAQNNFALRPRGSLKDLF